jgi:hypothetical protein
MKKIITVALVVFLFAGLAQASENIPMGLRAGFTSGPDQFHIGAHAFTGEIFSGVDLSPNIEIGFGSNSTIIALNGDFTYSFTELMTAPWGFYAGGELGLIYSDFTVGSDTNLGLSGLCGLTKAFDNGHYGLAELKLGLLDSPDLKITIGYTFF